MAYHQISLGSKVYFRGRSHKSKGLYVVTDRYVSHKGDYDQNGTIYAIVRPGESRDDEYLVERHELIDRDEIQIIHDTIMEAYANV